MSFFQNINCFFELTFRINEIIFRFLEIVFRLNVTLNISFVSECYFV